MKKISLKYLAASIALCVAGTAFGATPSEQTDSIAIAKADSLATELDDVVITAQRKLVTSDGATLTYSVSDDPESGSSNILDILRKVPGVTVDAEDNVRVNGQSNFKILINNREDPMLKGDLKNVLKSIPAASIKKIEVIAEPGAKYEAEGVGGILNIVTDSSTRLRGFMTQLQAWASPSNVGGSLNGKVKLHNVMLSATAAYNNGRLFQRYGHSHSETEDLSGGPNHLLTSDSRYKNPWDYHSVNVNMSWEPDTLNLFTLSANYSGNTYGNNGYEERAMFGPTYDPADPDASLLWRLTRTNDGNGSYYGLSTQASYQHSFRRSDNYLVLSYMFDRGWMKHDYDYTVSSLFGSPVETPYSIQHTSSPDYSHVAQLDYSNRFNSHHLLEAGAKMSLSHDRRDTYSADGADSGSAVIDEAGRVNVAQFRDIYAVYASYTGNYGNWNVKGGLRYEYTRMGLRYRVGDYPDFTTRLNDLVPNAAISYKLAGSTSLRLAYQMRIWRPGLQTLNPYVNTTSPGEISYGNPDLKSQKSHNVSIAYSNYEGQVSGSVKLSYRYMSNSITDIIFMKDNVMNTTYGNIGLRHQGSIDINGDWSVTNNLRLSLYLNTDYSYNKADSELLRAKKCGWTFYGNANVNYTLPCKVRLSAYGGYSSPYIDLNYKGTDYYFYGVSASRSFLKEDALTLSLRLSNILPASRTGSYSQTGESVRNHSSWTYKQWNVGFSISWKFGGLKAEVKSTSTSVEKDSTAGGGGKGGK